MLTVEKLTYLQTQGFKFDFYSEICPTFSLKAIDMARGKVELTDELAKALEHKEVHCVSGVVWADDPSVAYVLLHADAKYGLTPGSWVTAWDNPTPKAEPEPVKTKKVK